MIISISVCVIMDVAIRMNHIIHTITIIHIELGQRKDMGGGE